MAVVCRAASEGINTSEGEVRAETKALARVLKVIEIEDVDGS